MAAPFNSVKVPQYGIKAEVEGESSDGDVGRVRLFADAARMGQSYKTVDPPDARPGSILNYTVVLINDGVADAFNIRVVDALPPHSTFMNDLEVDGVPVGATADASGVFTWTGTVPLLTPVTLTFSAQLDPVIDNGTILTNTASIYEGTVLEVRRYASTLVRSEPCLTTSEKTADPGLEGVLAGGLITYTIALENCGDMDAQTVIVTDCIPVCTTFVPGSISATIGLANYYPDCPDCNNGCIVWQGPVTVTHPASPTAFITFQVKVLPGSETCETIINTAAVDDGFPDGQCGSVELEARSRILRGPNLLDSTKVVDKAVAEPGQQLDYTINVVNTGNERAMVKVTDALPPYSDYVAGSYTSSVGGGSFDAVSGLSWSGYLYPSTSVTLGFSVLVTDTTPNGTIITNTARLTSTDDLAYVVGYVREAGTLIISEPRLTTSHKDVVAGMVGYGGYLTYTITLINDGTQPAASVFLTDTMPAGTAYDNQLSVSPGAPAATYSAGSVLWNGPLAVGEEVTITFRVSITLQGVGTITNTATIDDGWHPPFDIDSPPVHVAGLQAQVPPGTYYCGDLICVPFWVYNVSGLQGFQVVMAYNNSVLEVDSIQAGSWFQPALESIKSFNNGLGVATVAFELNNQSAGLTGDGEIFVVCFRATGSGVGWISILASDLVKTPLPHYAPIPHNTVGGLIGVGERLIQGWAYLEGRLDHSGAEVRFGPDPSDFVHTAADGFYAFCPPVSGGQDFLLRVEHRAYLPAEKGVTSPVSGTITLSDVMLIGGDPAGVREDVVSPVPPTCPITITATLPGPPDQVVNVLDLVFVGARFGQSPGNGWTFPINVCRPDLPGYTNWRADLNSDGLGPVNIYDLVLVGRNFGATGYSPWP